MLFDAILTVATSVILHATLPDSGSLAQSLVALPWVWLLLRRVDAALPPQLPDGLHGRAPDKLPTAVCLTLGVLGLLIDSSGLDSLARCWAPLAWCTMVGLFSVWLPRAEALLRSDRSTRPSTVFLFAPLAVYLLVLPWSTSQRPPDGDEPWYLLVAHSLSHDFDADLADNYARGDSLQFVGRRIEPQPGDPVGPNGERYSRHLLTLPLLLALPYRIGGRIGALVTMALLSAALCWATLALARARPSPAAAQLAPKAPRPLLLAWGLLSYSSPLLLYSHQVWVEVPAALLTVCGMILLQTWRPPQENGWSMRSARPLAALATIAVLLPIFKLRFTLLSFGLLLLALIKLRRQRRTVALISCAAVLAVTALMAYNQLVFGNALRIHSWQELAFHRMDLRLLAARAAGLFFDASFGLLAAAPIWLLALAGIWIGLSHLFSRGVSRALESGASSALWQLTVVVGPYLFLVITRREWYGGWSPPFRYALVALPLLTLLVAHVLDDLDRSGRRQIARLLMAGTVLLQTIWLAVPGWTYNFADGRTLLADRLESSLGFDLLRILPSASRIRAASWLAPVFAVVFFLLIWFWSRLATSRVLVAPAAVLFLAAIPRLLVATPTWRIEPEARWVERDGGSMEPEQWMFDRTRLPEAWVFPDGSGFEAMVTPGGDWFELTVLGRLIRNRDADLEVTISVGGEHLGTLTFRDADLWVLQGSPRWRWPAPGRSNLRLQISNSRGPGPPGVVNGIAIDRVELDWFGLKTVEPGGQEQPN